MYDPVWKRKKNYKPTNKNEKYNKLSLKKKSKENLNEYGTDSNEEF